MHMLVRQVRYSLQYKVGTSEIIPCIMASGRSCKVIATTTDLLYDTSSCYLSLIPRLSEFTAKTKYIHVHMNRAIPLITCVC